LAYSTRPTDVNLHSGQTNRFSRSTALEFGHNSFGYSHAMSNSISDLKLMISGMDPVLNEGIYAYTSVPHGTDISKFASIATITEVEGITLVVSERQAIETGLPVLFRCSWITLNVHSDLSACGLTAAFSKVLADEEISCNVVAGAYHDHIFVPVALANKSLSVLKRLQSS
jgi:hypothetical protein